MANYDDRVRVQTRDSIDIVALKLQRATGSKVAVLIPPDANALQDIDDFSALRKIARERRLELTVVSPDRTVRGLAKILGFETEDVETGGQNEEWSSVLAPRYTVDLPEYVGGNRRGQPAGASGPAPASDAEGRDRTRGATRPTAERPAREAPRPLFTPDPEEEDEEAVEDYYDDEYQPYRRRPRRGPPAAERWLSDALTMLSQAKERALAALGLADSTADVDAWSHRPHPGDLNEPELEVDEPVERAYAVRGQRRSVATQTAGVGYVLPAVALVALVGVILLVLYLVPSAVVTIEPKRETVTQEVTIVVAPATDKTSPAAPGTAIVNSTPVEVTLSETATGQVFGSRLEPSTKAQGSVQFTSDQAKDVSVPEGTALGVVDGVPFITAKAVTVPAADPFFKGTFGKAQVAIVATKPGSVGNVGANKLQGRLDSGVYYINLAATSGGTDKKIPVVSEDDRKMLQAKAEESLKRKGVDELRRKLGEGQVLADVEPRFSDWQANFDHEAGQDANSLTVVLSAKVAGQSFKPADIDHAATQALTQIVAAQPSRNVRVLPETIKRGELRLEKADGGVATYRTSLAADTIYDLDEATRGRLRDAMAGKTFAEARQLIGGLPWARASQINRTPGWLPGDMPAIASRIDVRTGTVK